MWYAYTMEYYTAEKNNDILNLEGKWMEVENPDTERQLSYVLTHRWFFKQKAKKTSLQTIIPENLDSNEDTKRDLYRSNLHGK